MSDRSVTDEESVRRAIAAIHRIESPKLIARLTRLVRDVGLAEELAQDAQLAALEQWPASGIPENPGAWLMVTAKNRAINLVRREKLASRKLEELAHEIDARQDQAPIEMDAMLDDDIGDDLLRLVFAACHPVLTIESRVALTLRLLGGLTTEEIARGFLVSEPTIAQRISRAKKTLSEADVAFELPRGAELTRRLSSVLGVIYLIFNEGYSATAGDDWMRPQLCEDALRLGRIVAELAPNEAEAHGLVALMELHSSRASARLGSDGEPILLRDQNRALWDRLLVRRGLAALDRAEQLSVSPSGGADASPLPRGARGPYTLQAAIAACHARATSAEETDWPRIAALYSELAQVSPSPVVELNRAVAVGMSEGPAAALRIVDELLEEPALRGYHLLPSVRADFLAKLERFDEACRELERAASLTRNVREQKLLLERAAAWAQSRPS